MNTAELLRAAAAKVRQGWCQGALYDCYGNVCAIGAMSDVADRGDSLFAMREITRAALGLSGDVATKNNLDPIALWNDAPGQTAENVALGLERAADLWDNEHTPAVAWTHRAPIAEPVSQ